MSQKSFRITSSKFGIFLYPMPVDKNMMYLILAADAFQAEVLKHLLDFGALGPPSLEPASFRQQGVHGDGVTPIYQLALESFTLRLLPLRQLDETRAKILEELFAKKFRRLLTEPAQRGEIIRDIQFRFSQQQQCTECQRLGIADPVLGAFFEGLRALA